MRKEIIIFSIVSFIFGIVVGGVITKAIYKNKAQEISEEAQIKRDTNGEKISLPPGHPDISKDYQKEIQIKLEEVNKNPNNIDIIIELAFLYEQTRRYDDALIWYNRALELDNKNIDALNGAATICRINNDINKAKELYQEVIKIDEYDPNALLGLGWIALHIENNPKEAVRLWQLLIDNNDNFIYKTELQEEINRIKKQL